MCKHKFLVVPLEAFSYELSVTCEGCRTCKINRVRATYVPTLGSYSPMNLLVRNLTIIAGKKFKRNSNVLQPARLIYMYGAFAAKYCYLS